MHTGCTDAQMSAVQRVAGGPARCRVEWAQLGAGRGMLAIRSRLAFRRVPRQRCNGGTTHTQYTSSIDAYYSDMVTQITTCFGSKDRLIRLVLHSVLSCIQAPSTIFHGRQPGSRESLLASHTDLCILHTDVQASLTSIIISRRPLLFRSYFCLQDGGK